jgi:hypothetical protein
MNVIINRALVVPRSFLEDYGTDSFCLHESRRFLSELGLKDHITIDKGYYAKVEVCAYIPFSLHHSDWDKCSNAMIEFARSSDFDPDQLGLIATTVDNRKVVYRVN